MNELEREEGKKRAKEVRDYTQLATKRRGGKNILLFGTAREH